MKAKTHVAFSAMLISIFTNNLIHFSAVIFAIIADWDFFVKKIEHRTWSHSLVLLAPFIIFAVYADNFYLKLAVMAYCSHIIIDLMNNSNVYMFYPLKTPFRMFKYWTVRVGSLAEEAVFWVCVCLTLVILTWCENGTFEKQNLRAGIIFSDGLRFSKNVKNEYYTARKYFDQNSNKLIALDKEIALQRADSSKYSQFPISPSKVKTASERLKNLRAEKMIVSERLDSAKVDEKITGFLIPFE